MLILFGEKHFGLPILEGVRRELYCPKCKKNSTFMEISGKRFFHIWHIPLIPVGEKTIWLECDICDFAIFNYQEIIKEYEEKKAKEKDFEDMKKEMTMFVQQMEYIDVRCPKCKKNGKVKFPEGQSSAEAICHICGNIYEVKNKI